MKDVYLTKMIRWGNPDSHSYINACSDDLVLAKAIGQYHGKSHRGGKYDPEIITIEIPENISTIYIRQWNLENIDGRKGKQFGYEIYLDGEEEFTFKVKDLVEEKLSMWELEIDTKDDYFNDIKNVEDYLDIQHCFSDDVVEFLKNEYERLLRS